MSVNAFEKNMMSSSRAILPTYCATTQYELKKIHEFGTYNSVCFREKHDLCLTKTIELTHVYEAYHFLTFEGSIEKAVLYMDSTPIKTVCNVSESFSFLPYPIPIYTMPLTRFYIEFTCEPKTVYIQSFLLHKRIKEPVKIPKQILEVEHAFVEAIQEISNEEKVIFPQIAVNQLAARNWGDNICCAKGYTKEEYKKIIPRPILNSVIKENRTCYAVPLKDNDNSRIWTWSFAPDHWAFYSNSSRNPTVHNNPVENTQKIPIWGKKFTALFSFQNENITANCTKN